MVENFQKRIYNNHEINHIYTGYLKLQLSKYKYF